MESLISWVVAFLAGSLSVIFLLTVVGSAAGVIFTIIHLFKGRGRVYAFLIYIFIGVASLFLREGVFWLNEQFSTGSRGSVVIFWTLVIITTIACIKSLPGFLKDIWKSGIVEKEISPEELAREAHLRDQAEEYVKNKRKKSHYILEDGTGKWM